MSNTHKSRIVTTIEVTQIPDGEEERYIKRYLSPSLVNSNKKVYLYPEVHATLSKMIRNLGKKGVSIGAYASEIILDHIAQNHAVMNSVYERNHKKLF